MARVFRRPYSGCLVNDSSTSCPRARQGERHDGVKESGCQADKQEHESGFSGHAPPAPRIATAEAQQFGVSAALDGAAALHRNAGATFTVFELLVRGTKFESATPLGAR